LLSLLPALVLVSIAVSAVWGDGGLLARHELKARLERDKASLAALERANQRLVSELVWLEKDPVLLERAVAEELGWAREGTTLYRFEDP
jgi:cell division protein FtsB